MLSLTHVFAVVHCSVRAVGVIVSNQSGREQDKGKGKEGEINDFIGGKNRVFRKLVLFLCSEISRRICTQMPEIIGNACIFFIKGAESS